MGEMIKLNHHSGGVLPYHVDSKRDLKFILEQKDPSFKAPFFEDGLNFEGGNFVKSVNPDKSPEDTVKREVNEEFWEAYEAPESLNEMLGQDFLAREPQVAVKYSASDVERIKKIVPVFFNGMSHAGDYIMTVNPPIAKEKPLIYGSSIFVKELSKDEFEGIEALIKEFDGKLTTDNLKWGSKIGSFSLQEINHRNMKFSWGYCGVMNELLSSGKLPAQPYGVLRPLQGLVQIAQMSYPADIERTAAGCPTYAGLESAEYEFFVKQKK